MIFKKFIFSFSVFLIIFFFSPTKIFGQTGDSPVTIRTIDMRGQKSIKATYVAIKASEKDVVVVLIRGGNVELIEKTKAQLRALTHNGYNRVGVVLSDLKPAKHCLC